MYGSFILNNWCSTLPITLPSDRLQQVALGKQNERAACPKDKKEFEFFSSSAYILRNYAGNNNNNNMFKQDDV